jgi:hypothetical protein
MRGGSCWSGCGAEQGSIVFCFFSFLISFPFDLGERERERKNDRSTEEEEREINDNLSLILPSFSSPPRHQRAS